MSLPPLPDPSTLSPNEAGDWIGRMMFAFPPSDERGEFVRLLGLRVKEFRLAAPQPDDNAHTDGAS